MTWWYYDCNNLRAHLDFTYSFSGAFGRLKSGCVYWGFLISLSLWQIESDEDEVLRTITLVQSEDQPLLSARREQQTMSSEKYKDSEKGDVAEEKKMTSAKLFVVGSILVTELCERLTYYSVVANMVLFCSSILNYSDDDASVITLVFAGKSFTHSHFLCIALKRPSFFT